MKSEADNTTFSDHPESSAGYLPISNPDSATDAKKRMLQSIQSTKNPVKKLYYWVLHWAFTPYGVWALILTAFSESSFFPIPPDILLIPLSFSRPKKALWYAFLSSTFSVLGGVLGYAIGLWLMDAIGIKLLELYGAMEQFDKISQLYHQYSGLAVATAGFTPIPYKIFTIAAGACRINFAVFIIASTLSRSARFFILAGLLALFGEKIKKFIDKYFNIFSIVFMILLIGGFFLIKFVIGK